MRAMGIVLLLALSGCSGPTVLTKPGATSVDFDRDKAQCTYEVKLGTAGYRNSFMRTDIGSALDTAIMQADLIKDCMLARDWTPLPPQTARQDTPTPLLPSKTPIADWLASTEHLANKPR
jgi:hypothetical protein